MTPFNFNEIIERKNTNSLKYDFAKEHNMPDNILPLWVADMDFRTPPAVIDALAERCQHGIFGYTDIKPNYISAVQKWYSERFGWKFGPEWLVTTPGVVFAIFAAVRALTNEGDAVLVQRPVYYPFFSAVTKNNRRLINNPLVNTNGSYSIDFEDFEKKIIAENIKLFILCNPHNPVGRVWTKDELTRLGEICVKYGVKVVSDEIHSDFVYSGYQHTVFANINPSFANIAMTCTSPSKTFNLAGLQVSNIIISNPEIRSALKDEIDKTGYSQLNSMGIIACQAAYDHGSEWLESLKKYLEQNIIIATEFLNKRLPKVQVTKPEGTYLLWINLNQYNLNKTQLENLIVNYAKLWLDRGTLFGPEGEGFQRINIACQSSTLYEALDRLEIALSKI